MFLGAEEGGGKKKAAPRTTIPRGKEKKEDEEAADPERKKRVEIFGKGCHVKREILGKFFQKQRDIRGNEGGGGARQFFQGREGSGNSFCRKSSSILHREKRGRSSTARQIKRKKESVSPNATGCV